MNPHKGQPRTAQLAIELLNAVNSNLSVPSPVLSQEEPVKQPVPQTPFHTTDEHTILSGHAPHESIPGATVAHGIPGRRFPGKAPAGSPVATRLLEIKSEPADASEGLEEILGTLDVTRPDFTPAVLKAAGHHHLDTLNHNPTPRHLEEPFGERFNLGD